MPDTVNQQIPFTTIVGVDRHHVQELELVWPSWKQYKPEILRSPLLLVCDGSISSCEWQKRLRFLDHPDFRWIPWHLDNACQREKMLNGITFAAARFVHTPWFLKLDTDVVATGDAKWIDPAWFEPDQTGQLPAFIASPWNYTKPADAIERLDRWAHTVPPLAAQDALVLKRKPGKNRIIHPRITSWCYFGNTVWTRKVVRYCSDRLPIASHDTFLWYCAERSNHFYRRVRMSQRGWKHFGRFSSLKRYFQLAGKTEERPTPACLDTVPNLPSLEAKLSGNSSVSTAPVLQRGIVYLLSGTSHAVRLVVSLWSLRRYYSGQVIVYTVGTESHWLGRMLAEDPRLNVTHHEYPQRFRKKNATFLHKLSVLQDCPFTEIGFLDADTLITGDLSELFPDTPENEVVVTQFSDWTTTHRRIKKRIVAWKQLPLKGRLKCRIERLADKALMSYPAINVGVFSIRRDSPLLKKWLDLAVIGRKTFICDEIALQMLFHYHNYRMLDCRWNCSPVYASSTDDVRLWHMHGDKHLRTPAIALWWSAYTTVLAQNYAQIQTWTPLADKKLTEYLNQIQTMES